MEAGAGALPQWIHAGRPTPVLERTSVGRQTVCARHSTYNWSRREQVPVNGPRQVGGMDINIVRRDRQALPDFALNSQRSLLRLRIPVVRLAEEEYRSERRGAGIADGHKRSQIRLRDT